MPHSLSPRLRQIWWRLPPISPSVARRAPVPAVKPKSDESPKKTPTRLTDGTEEPHTRLSSGLECWTIAHPPSRDLDVGQIN